ncbi:MAG: hypothetical protein ACREOO_17380 [bacterium]
MADHTEFKIDNIDMGGRWLDFADFWLSKAGAICFVCSDENIMDIISTPFGPEATFHATVEDAINAIK